MTQALHALWRELSDRLLIVLAHSQDRIAPERLAELGECVAAGEYGVTVDLLSYLEEEEGLVLRPHAAAALDEVRRLLLESSDERTSVAIAAGRETALHPVAAPDTQARPASPIDHEDAYWRHVNTCPFPRKSTARRQWVLENPKFAYDGTLWTRTRHFVADGSGRRLREHRRVYRGDDGRVVQVDLAPGSRRADPDRRYGPHSPGE